MSNYPNADDRRDARRGGYLALRWVLAIIVVIVLIGWGLWALGVFTSDVRGRGDAIKNKNTGTNRVLQQERFEDMYANIKSADQRIDIMVTAAKTDKSVVNTTNLTGAMNFCVTAVNDYNAQARKYSAKDFRSTDLPSQIDNTDPTTDCKESVSS